MSIVLASQWTLALQLSSTLQAGGLVSWGDWEFLGTVASAEMIERLRMRDLDVEAVTEGLMVRAADPLAKITLALDTAGVGT